MLYGEEMEVEVKTEEGEEATQMTEATGGTATVAGSAGVKVEEGEEEQQVPVSPTARKRHAEAAAAAAGGGKAQAAAAAHVTQGTFALRPAAAPLADGLATPKLKTPGAAGEKAPGTAKVRAVGGGELLGACRVP